MARLGVDAEFAARGASASWRASRARPRSVSGPGRSPSGCPVYAGVAWIDSTNPMTSSIRAATPPPCARPGAPSKAGAERGAQHGFVPSRVDVGGHAHGVGLPGDDGVGEVRTPPPVGRRHDEDGAHHVERVPARGRARPRPRRRRRRASAMWCETSSSTSCADVAWPSRRSAPAARSGPAVASRCGVAEVGRVR